MKQQTGKRIKKGILIFLGVLILLPVLTISLLRFYGKKALLKKQKDEVSMSAPEKDAVLEDEGNIVTYRGEKYRYNDHITAVLCMGVDKEKLEQDAVAGKAGQADMLMLAILDVNSGEAELWNISRDAMTDVDIYNVDGEYVRTDHTQLCLAYAYGDGREKSCQNTVKALSRLLYGMPIQSYAALDLDVIGALNDAVGGVEVTIHEGDILPAKFKAGTTVLLNAEDAERYVRSRRDEAEGEALDSNNNRMARQKQYMVNFIRKAMQMTQKDLSVPLTLFQTATKDRHMVTNIDAAKITYLTTIFSKVNFSDDSFWTLPGEVREKDGHAAFYVDDQSLYEKILDTFYIKCQEKQ